MKQADMEAHLLGSNDDGLVRIRKKAWKIRILCFLLPFMLITIIGLVIGGSVNHWVLRGESKYGEGIGVSKGDSIDSELGVVAADDGRCSEIGASVLRRGGHAVDAAVATALCLGVVNPTSSGIGGGAFMVVRSSSVSQTRTEAFDMRETAPSSASQNMYQNNPQAKYAGALSMGVPGELAGLHEAWKKYGRLTWKSLFQPAIRLAKEGFEVSGYLGHYIICYRKRIMNDPGLRNIFAPHGNLLKEGDLCYNTQLGQSLEAVAEHGPQVFYNGTIGENFVKDVREAGGILTMKDLSSYEVKVTDAMTVKAMGYTIYGMPPSSSGTLGLSLVLNVFDSYENSTSAAEGDVGLHRLIEALKHMFAIRMNLGDPDFENITHYVNDMLSPAFAKQIQRKILDNTTFPPEYYMSRWSQLTDHGTSHFCVVDADRNAVSMTTTVNSVFGAGVLSSSTGIVLNNEMDDFSTPTDISPDKLPPAPANFIEPNKRPLSSMTPIIVTKDGLLVGVIGGSGGMNIIPAVAQVFLNRFVLGMEPSAAIESPRIYHKLIPNVVRYENLTAFGGNHIELSKEKRAFLEERGHQLQPIVGGAITQLIIQTLQHTLGSDNGKGGKDSNHNILQVQGTLTAVCDPRKGGIPAAI